MNKIIWRVLVEAYCAVYYYLINPLRCVLTKEGRAEERRYQKFLQIVRDRCAAPPCPVHSEDQQRHEEWENEGGKSK